MHHPPAGGPQASGRPFRLSPLTAALLGVGCGGLALGFATTAHAQQTLAQPVYSQPVEVVRVIDRLTRETSSLKFTAPLLDTPQTISVIPEGLFNAQGARDLTDVLRNTPGISFSAGENGFAANNDNFTMRGFDTSGSVFVDNVRDSGNYSRDVFNLEQVEVIKGAAADNGRGNAGGYVNLVTKTPQLGSFIRGTTGYGFDQSGDADNRGRVTLDINEAFSDTGAGRLNLLYQDGGVAGREHVENRTIGIAPSLAFGLGGATRLTLSAQYMEQDSLPDWGVPAAMMKDMMRYDRTAARADRENFYGLKSDYDDTRSTAVLARIEHSFSPNLILSNQTRWAETERDAVYTVPFGYDPDTQLVTTQRQAYDRTTSSLSNQTNLSMSFSTGEIRHTLAAGLELTREKSEALRFGTEDVAPADIFNPDPRRAPVSALTAQQSADVKIDTVALYVYDTLEFNEHWQLTGGLRAEQYRVDIDSTDLGAGAPQGPDGYDVKESTVSGKLGVVYKPSRNGSIYASFGISALPPGSYLSNPDISRSGDNAFPGLTGQNNEGARVQRSHNYEIGTKWELIDDRLSTTAALFRTERRNVGISGREPGDPSSPVLLRGYGKQIVEGVELSVAGQLTDAWSVFAGVLVLDSERKHSAYLDAARREANPDDYGAVLRTSGDELAFTPKRTANLWTTYEFPFGLTVGGGLQYVSDSKAGRPDDADRIIPIGRDGKLPSYTVLNLMATYQLSEQWLLRLNVDNVTDELYATSTNWPTQRVFLGPPRSYVLSADFRF